MEDITRRLPSESVAEVQKEARYLRAVAATDLLFLAEVTHTPELAVRISRAAGVSAEGLLAFLQTELRAVASGAFRPSALEAVSVLTLLSQSDTQRRARVLHLQGHRRDLLYLDIAKQAFQSDTPMDSLAAMGRDPCGHAGRCAEPFSVFGPKGRKALAALTEAARALSAAQQAERGGDPLAHALHATIAEHKSWLSDARLSPPPVMPEGTIEAGDAGTERSTDVVVRITQADISLGFVPSIAVENGRVVMKPLGAPALPSPRTIRMPANFRPVLQPVDEVSTALTEMTGHLQSVQVSVTSAPDVPSHVLARVLLSAQRVQRVTELTLGARGADGLLRTVRVKVATAETDATAALKTRLKIRLGGFALAVGQGSESIPRIAGPNGWQFDIASLASRLATRPQTASIQYMGTVTADPVIRAALVLEPQSDPLVILPPL